MVLSGQVCRAESSLDWSPVHWASVRGRLARRAGRGLRTCAGPARAAETGEDRDGGIPVRDRRVLRRGRREGEGTHASLGGRQARLRRAGGRGPRGGGPPAGPRSLWAAGHPGLGWRQRCRPRAPGGPEAGGGVAAPAGRLCR